MIVTKNMDAYIFKYVIPSIILQPLFPISIFVDLVKTCFENINFWGQIKVKLQFHLW